MRAARCGCFAVRRGQAHYRADVSYNSLTEEVERRLAKPHFALAPISSFEVVLQYGCSQRATEDPVGIPILRMNNLQAEGWDLTDLKYVEITDDELRRWRLNRGDIVFNRTNSKELVGKCEVFDQEGIWVFASYLMRLRVDASKAEPKFVSAFLNTKAGRIQIDRESRQIIGMSNINAEEIRTLRVPLPKLNKQRELLAALDDARVTQHHKLQQADELFAGLDDFVHDKLELAQDSRKNHDTTYAVRSRDVFVARKLYPDYFHPERMSTIRSIQSRYTGDGAATLIEVADFVRDQRIVRPGEDYLGLANVQSNTGERIESNEKDGEGACFEYAEGDVLFARLRPYLNKVYRAESGGVCSTEFHIIRIRRNENGKQRLIPDYLAAVMRSSVVLAQTRHMMTGNTHPRLANEDVLNLLIPVPDHQVQKSIAAEAVRRRDDARRMREDATRLWDAAKRRFEEELLGPDDNQQGLLVPRVEGGHNGE